MLVIHAALQQFKEIITSVNLWNFREFVQSVLLSKNVIRCLSFYLKYFF